MGDGTRVLVVEDDAEHRAVYDRVLSEFYAVSTVASGATAVETMTDDTDVVVLDRPLPELSVARLVDELTNRHHDCCVGLVTRSEPYFDVTRWLGVDDYLVKPVTTEGLRDTVDGLLALAEYDATYRTLSQKRVRKSVLAQEQRSTRRPQNPDCARLRADIERLERDLEELAEQLDGTARALER
ncbi:response regulator [Haloarcula salinisoli]|uniref:Response regulator n=1 Tax=Haloarcula salinisoli TaxID=2487746 RepID=A0A8J7YG84_9EURY|nr:response regulator [Halomicroarcula salinisoli]MBX0304927.1 response regulator [Halomicroarcula salinisoli]